MNLKRVLIVRNDKLGDFMLVWPALAILKSNLPGVTVTALVPTYTAPLAEICPWIDAIIIDEPAKGAWWLRRKIRHGRFDALLTYFSTGRVALAGCLAGIPYRLAPATKLAQFCYNHRLKQRRSLSQKPEYAYNIDLSLRLVADFGNSAFTATATAGDYLPRPLERPFLRLGDDAARLKSAFCARHALDVSSNLIFIHPGSGGSATNLRPEQYVELANTIACDDCAFVITAGPGEETIAQQVARGITAPATVSTSEKGLVDFARTLQIADLFISGSTGPLHIAAALDRPTAAFYPGHRSATPLRWQTLNAPERRLAFTPPEGSEREVQGIDVVQAAETISRRFFAVDQPSR